MDCHAHALKGGTAIVCVQPAGSSLVIRVRRKGPDGQEHGPDRYVFGNDCGERIKRVRHAWDNTCKRTNIEDRNIHDLRREFGSRLLESGAGIHDVSYWLGHTNVATTSHYHKTTVERLQRGARAFEEARQITRRLPGAEPEGPTLDQTASFPREFWYRYGVLRKVGRCRFPGLPHEPDWTLEFRLAHAAACGARIEL